MRFRSKYKEMIYRIGGEEIPFLGQREKEIVEDMILQTTQEIETQKTLDENNPFYPYINEEEHNIQLQRLSILENNLGLIIKSLQLEEISKDIFVREYPNWRKIRLQAVEALMSIGHSINKDRKLCNIYRLVGNSTSLVGGGLCVASAAMIPFTAGLSTPLAIIGGAATVVGSTASVGSSVVELTLLNNKIKETKDILEKDRRAFEVMNDWLITVNDLSQAVQSILESDTDKNIEYISKAIQEFLVTVKEIKNKVEQNVLIKILIMNIFKGIPTLLPLELIGPLISLLLIFHLLIGKKDFTKFSKTSLRTLGVGFSSILGLPLGVMGPAAAIIKTDTVVAKGVAKAIAARGIVAVIGMSLDAASLILTSIDVHRGSLSGKGQSIIEIAQKMEEEINVLEEVYFKLLTT